MINVSKQYWGSLVKWNATAFVVAGIFRLLHAGLGNLEETTAMTLPAGTIDLIALVWLVAASVGLFGLFPRMVDRAPRLSKIGVGLAALAAIASVLSVLLKYVTGLAEAPGPFKIIPLLYTLGLPLSFLFFGVASWRTRTPSRTVGLLLLLVFGTFLVFVAAIFAQSTILGAVQGILFAGAVLALSYVIHTGATPFDTAESERTG